MRVYHIFNFAHGAVLNNIPVVKQLVHSLISSCTMAEEVMKNLIHYDDEWKSCFYGI